MYYTDYIFPIGSALIILILFFIIYEICTCLVCKKDEEDNETSVLTGRPPASCSSSRRSRRRSGPETFPAYQTTQTASGRTRVVMPLLARNSVGQIVLLHQVDGTQNYRILEEYHAANGHSIYRSSPNQNRNEMLATHQQLYTWDSQAGLASSCHPTYPQTQTPTPSAPPPPYAE